MTKSLTDRLTPSGQELELRLFGLPGLFRLGGEGEAQRLLGAGKPLLLLARLALDAEGLSRDELAAFLWPGMPEERARASARQALHMLRQQLGQEALIADRQRVRLADRVASDATLFLAAIAAGDDARAIAIYRGPFMQEQTVPDANAADQWLGVERLRFAQLFERAARREVARLRDDGRMAEALPLAVRVRDSAPTDSLHWQQLLELLDDAGSETRLQQEVDALRLLLQTDAWEEPRERREAKRLIARFDTASPKEPAATPETVASGAPLALSRGRFVGRRAEMALLTDTWSGVTQSRRSARLLISGHAGVGKTRLLMEFIRRPQSEGATVVWVRARRGGRDDALGFVVDLIEALTAQPGSLGISQESATALVALVPSLTTLFPGAAWREPQGDATRLRAIALRDLITTLTEERPLMVVLDDVQWADASSLTLIDDALRTLDAVPALLVATTRPREMALMSQWPGVELAPLGREQVEALIRSTERTEVDGAVVDVIMRATGGIPLHTIPALRLLMTSGLIAQREGTWRLTSRAEGATSISLRDLIAASVRDLSAAERTLLTFLALVDSPVHHARLAPLLADPSALDALLQTLDEADLILRTADGAWRIAHDTVADAVLHAADIETRRMLSLQLATDTAASAGSYVEMRRAVRLFLEADAPEAMIAAVEQWHARTPNLPRGEALADLVLGSGVSPMIRRRLVRAIPRSSRQTVPLLIAVVVGVLSMWGAIVLWARQPARLVVVNVPTYLARSGIPPLLEVHDRVGRITRALDGQRVTASVVSGSDSIIGNLSLPIADGSVSLDSLRFVEDVAVIGREKSTVLRLDTPGIPPSRLELFRRSRDSLWLEAGVLAGQPLDPRRPVVRVAPGDSVTGWIRVRYTSSHAAILIMMSQFANWMPPRTDTVSVSSLLTPAERAFLNVPLVAYRAPRTRGTYWLGWMYTSEPAAVWIASSTSWRCGAPVWDDGNEKAHTPDSLLARSWGTGAMLQFMKLTCDQRKARAYEPTPVPLLTVQVIVE